ncbi:MAG: T9SS type A sorting domain-containing protein [Bacteroidota bacterium]
MKPGKHSVHFDASRLSTGIYIYTLKAGNFTATKKLLLMK